jgi:hypothetical protein
MNMNKMNESEKVSKKEDKGKIANFLLRDTTSLRNESDFIDLSDMVHPLTFTYNLEEYPNLHLIPVFDKINKEEIIKRCIKLLQ